MADNASRWARPLLSRQPDTRFDLPAGVGQRAGSFRFDVIDALSGAPLGQVHPLAGATAPVLRHDTSRTICRDLSLDFGRADSTWIDPIRHRIAVSMTAYRDGATVPLGAVGDWPLGRYMIVDRTSARSSAGTLASCALVDEMFIVDQPIEESFTPTDTTGFGLQEAVPVHLAVARLLHDLPVSYELEPSNHATSSTWPPGTSRAQILNDLAVEGGYFAPWCDHTGVLRLVQAFDPAQRVADIDLDSPPRVLRDSIAEVTDLLDAPNRFVVVGNAADSDQIIVGTYDVPASAPHSRAARGFIAAQVDERQVTTTEQATDAARTIGLSATITERAELSTPPDPRHDAYTVLRWRGQQWLEISWAMELREGGAMRHVMRRAYQ